MISNSSVNVQGVVNEFAKRLAALDSADHKTISALTEFASKNHKEAAAAIGQNLVEKILSTVSPR